MIASGHARGLFKRRLLAWYDREKRDMPWRKSKDPYHILLSEFMLQQTQVQTVIPYFERFISTFPTVKDLADADLDDVLRLWEGLGYYTRARNLHKAAAAISDDFNERVPDTLAQLLSLPGFGPYTSAAVASIAFQKPHAVLDGNVIRVLSRIGCVQEETNRPQVKTTLQTAADDLLNAKRPGDHNQAMMELGATICKPRQALCEQCPVRPHCLAEQRGLVAEIPRKTKPKPRPERVYAALLIQKGDLWLISRRKPEGLLGGLWEFPSVETAKRSHQEDLPDRVSETLQIRIDNVKPFRLVKNAYTHFSAVVHAYTTTWSSGRPASDDHDSHLWVDRVEIQNYAYSRIARKLVDALTQDDVHDQIGINLLNLKEPTG